MTDWTFHNRSRRGRLIPIESPEHAVELLMEASGEDEYAVCIEFRHTPLGIIDAVAGQEFANLTYDPSYDPTAHSLSGFRTALPVEPATDNEMYFVDDTDTLSSIRGDLVPILDAVRAIQYILIHNDYPVFLNWRRGA